MHISSPHLLTGKFNAHLRDLCFLFCDEAFLPEDRASEGRLKGLITEETLAVEPKGVDARMVRNRLGIMGASNLDYVINATEDERRHAVFDVSEKFRGDRSYFTNLVAQMENGGAGAMFYDLQRMDLGDWHPRWDIPQTAALAEQKTLNADAIANHPWYPIFAEALGEKGDPKRAEGFVWGEDLWDLVGLGGADASRRPKGGVIGRIMKALGFGKYKQRRIVQGQNPKWGYDRGNIYDERGNVKVIQVSVF